MCQNLRKKKQSWKFFHCLPWYKNRKMAEDIEVMMVNSEKKREQAPEPLQHVKSCTQKTHVPSGILFLTQSADVISSDGSVAESNFF